MAQNDEVKEVKPAGHSVSQAVEDYIKVIYKLQDAAERVSTNDIARVMGTSPASVTKMSKYLAEHKLLTHEPYYGVRLTSVGEKIALETIRHHRLLELYLVQALGYGWDEVDAEAERLEHHISEEFEERIDRMLGRPLTDPHGDPIPTREGHVATPGGIRLDEARVGEPLTVMRVSDGSPEALRYLTQIGIHLGAQVEVQANLNDSADDSGAADLSLSINGETRQMASSLAARVFVTAADSPAVAPETPPSKAW